MPPPSGNEALLIGYQPPWSLRNPLIKALFLGGNVDFSRYPWIPMIFCQIFSRYGLAWFSRTSKVPTHFGEIKAVANVWWIWRNCPQKSVIVWVGNVMTPCYLKNWKTNTKSFCQGFLLKFYYFLLSFVFGGGASPSLYRHTHMRAYIGKRGSLSWAYVIYCGRIWVVPLPGNSSKWRFIRIPKPTNVNILVVTNILDHPGKVGNPKYNILIYLEDHPG